ncbi:hypothetical protein [Candidatus Spongiisocius sp.]|uniref:hypothetical protein n=1 Tax=Candidatus Spongiisocius sp. TaxID=3101273 RepID=UPI003B5CE8BE
MTPVAMVNGRGKTFTKGEVQNALFFVYVSFYKDPITVNYKVEQEGGGDFINEVASCTLQISGHLKAPICW